MTTTYVCNTPIYCSSDFKWKDNTGTADASQLNRIGTHISSPDFKGIAIQSAKTGKIKYFEPIYDEDMYDGEFTFFGCDNVFVQIWNY
jgi:hypothetical protein